MITSRQIRAARALLLMGQMDLAKRAGIGIATIRRIEGVDGITGTAQSLSKIRDALEEAGVMFIDDDGTKGPGVRLGQSLLTKRRLT